jgi:hypothetical protein
MHRAHPKKRHRQGHCYELSTTGWCCFWSLVCTMPICCCIPCLGPCSFCHRHFQRPVYGYPLQCQILTAGGDKATGGEGAAAAADGAPDAAAAVAAATAAAEASASAPAAGSPTAARAAAARYRIPPLLVSAPPPDPAAARTLAAAAPPYHSPSPSPRPQSIFVPPSAVPAIGFSIPSPGYPKYKPEPHVPGGSNNSSASGTPRGTYGGVSNGGTGSGAAIQLPTRMGSPQPAAQPQYLVPGYQQQHHHQQRSASPLAREERGSLSPAREAGQGGADAGGGGGAGARRSPHPNSRPSAPQQRSSHAYSYQHSGPGAAPEWGSRQNSRQMSQDGVSGQA